MFVDFNILNQLGSPSINSNTFANRPAAGQTGRLFVSTDTFEIYRDTGTGWDLIGGPGAGTITGTGTATQVAYFTGAQTIGSSSNLFWDNTNTRLGIGTSSPGVRLDIHGTGNMLHLNATGATANTLMSFQRLGSNLWRLGEQYSGGFNYFELHNAVLNNNAAEFQASTNKATFGALETYSSGGATGSLFSYTLTVPNGTNFTGPNVIGNVNSALTLNLGGNTTVPNSTRQGLEGNSRINFTGPGTLTVAQGALTVRAFSALSSVYSFAGSSSGTITHLAGLRVCFPDNIGLGAINITNNYGILINDQTTGTGTVNYTNRWGIYQEGISDLNYFNGNLLVKTTINAGYAADIQGSFRNTTDTFLNTTSGATNIAVTTGLPTITVPSGTASVMNVNGGTIVNYSAAINSPFTQNIRIDIVFLNWGGNNILTIADLIVTSRQWANTSGVAFGKVFATNTAGGATFATFNTANITTSNCTLTAASGGNYTLRLTIDPTSNTDNFSVYLYVTNGAIRSAISSITISLV